jgi:hypothetical protein
VTDGPESPDVAEVRRLLAEARHTGPMPDDVATRLDDVLADLSRPEPTTESDADVVPLPARRRRKAAGWLLAAAAVVVGGVVVVPHLPSGGSSSSMTAGGEPASNDEGLSNTGKSGGSPGPRSTGSTPPRRHGGPVVVRPHHFSAVARATQKQLRDSAHAYAQNPVTLCADLPAGLDAVAAQYRNAPAALVFQRPSDGGQVVELYLCGHAEPVRSTTLPVP